MLFIFAVVAMLFLVLSEDYVCAILKLGQLILLFLFFIIQLWKCDSSNWFRTVTLDSNFLFLFCVFVILKTSVVFIIILGKAEFSITSTNICYAYRILVFLDSMSCRILRLICIFYVMIIFVLCPKIFCKIETILVIYLSLDNN